MSQTTRCRLCDHTPGCRGVTHAETPPCLCCHDAAAVHPAYGPTPVQRPRWPKLNECAFGDTRPQVECPLVVRRNGKSPARHVRTPLRERIGLFTTGR